MKDEIPSTLNDGAPGQDSGMKSEWFEYFFYKNYEKTKHEKLFH